MGTQSSGQACKASLRTTRGVTRATHGSFPPPPQMRATTFAPTTTTESRSPSPPRPRRATGPIRQKGSCLPKTLRERRKSHPWTGSLPSRRRVKGTNLNLSGTSLLSPRNTTGSNPTTSFHPSRRDPEPLALDRDPRIIDSRDLPVTCHPWGHLDQRSFCPRPGKGWGILRGGKACPGSKRTRRDRTVWVCAGPSVPYTAAEGRGSIFRNSSGTARSARRSPVYAADEPPRRFRCERPHRSLRAMSAGSARPSSRTGESCASRCERRWWRKTSLGRTATAKTKTKSGIRNPTETSYVAPPRPCSPLL
mmetsp:Transcript_8188/g.27214  ORF Transcript_8188/g.27214 Transcript_8188/m.27214 type:complete len:307 (+) Transcript_8188:2203-3123(+)